MRHDICDLLKYAIGKEENYNRIGNIIYKNFGIHSAEQALVCLFVYEEMKKNGKTEGDLSYDNERYTGNA